MGKHKINRAVFLDRDGVVNRAIVREGKPYPPLNIAEFEILPSVADACLNLKKAGYLIVIATNQPDVGRGTLLQSVVEEIHALLFKAIPIDQIEVCYHPGRGLSDCDCRKPLPGMLIRASKKFNIDLGQSWMVGDRGGDIECGYSAGCKTILIGDAYKEKLIVQPNYKAQNLLEAVTIILN